MLKKFTLLLVFLCSICLFAGCGQENNSDKNTLRYASSDYTTINPILNTHDELPDVIFSGLMTYDADGNPIPELAESYTYDENTYTYTFRLRPNIKWHDGKDFSAEDVKFTLDVLTKDKTLAASITDNYKDITDIKVIDNNTINITLKQPNAAMLDYLTVGILPKHLLEGKDIMTDSFNQHPIGTGRYKFVSWEPGQNIIVAKNENYYKNVPKIDKIIFKIVPDENARALQVKSGELDLAWLNAQNTDKFRDDKNFAVYDFTTADYRAIAPNFKDEFWQKNANLMSVLGYALDKQAIINATMNGQGEIAYSPIQLNPVFNNPNVNHYDYNPALFAQKMQELGWQKGADGIYEKNGERLSFSVDVRENEEERIDIANIASQQFKAAGVEMKVNIVQKLDWNSLESFLIGQAAPFDPDNGTYVLFVTDASGNYTHYSNPKVDQDLKLAREEINTNDRKIAYDNFQQAWAQDPAYIMIAYLKGNYVATPKLKGLSTKRVLSHHAVGVMWNVEDWSLEG